MRFVVALAVWLFFWSLPAAADLYRWVDPESGSVKFSNYPPPWYGDGAQQRPGPKVEKIRAVRAAPARSAEPLEVQGDRKERQAAEDSAPIELGGTPEVRRAALLELVSRRVAALVAAAPEDAARVFNRLLAPLQQLERLDQQLNASNPADEAARMEERWKLAAPLESRRTALMQRVSALRPPPATSAPEAIESAWRGAQQQISALESINEATGLIDARKRNAQHFELQALIEQVFAAWKPHVDTGTRRSNRGT